MNGSPNAVTRILAGLAALLAGAVLFLSICGLLAYFVLPLRGEPSALQTNTLLGSAIAVGVLYGAATLLLARAFLSGRTQASFRLPSPWLFMALFFLAIGIGQAVLFSNLGVSYTFPPWHVVASLMVPLAVLAYASRRLPPAPAIPIGLEMAWGGIGTVLLASVFELVIGLVLITAAVAVLLALLGPVQLQALANRFESLAQGASAEQLARALLQQQPALLVTLGAAGLTWLSVFVPLIEETIKAAGPALAIGLTRPRISRALLFGIAAGAGYAFSENLLNGALGLGPGGGGDSLWALPMLLRSGSSLVHIANTAAISVGVYYALIRRRRLYLLLFLFAALFVHGLWNLVSLVLIGAAYSAGLSDNLTGQFAGAGAVLTLLALALLLVLLLACAFWIVWLVGRARDEETRAPGPVPTV